MQVCLQLRGGDAYAHKRYHRGQPGCLSLPGVVELTGAWPTHSLSCVLPGDPLEVHADFVASEGMHWWARLPAETYAHYTTFGAASVRWSTGEAAGHDHAVALFDHGWGRSLSPLPSPLARFRYEVLRADGFGTVLVLGTEGPTGLPLRCEGVVRSEHQPPLVMDEQRTQVLEWTRSPNHEGVSCAIPDVWEGFIAGPHGRLTYRARRTTEPLPHLGDGFLYAFAFEGEGAGRAFPIPHIRGDGYAEQMGPAWHR